MQGKNLQPYLQNIVHRIGYSVACGARLICRPWVLVSGDYWVLKGRANN